MDKVNLAQAFAAVDETWRPRIVGAVNDAHVKLARLDGAFVWHHHEHEDELFLVMRGTLRMLWRNEVGAERETVLKPGEFLVVPRGVEHCPVADEETHVVLLEPKGTVNTGNVRNERTREASWL